MCSTSSKAIFGKGCHLSHSARSATDFCSLFRFPQFWCGARQTHAFLRNQVPHLQCLAYLKIVITWWQVSSAWQIPFPSFPVALCWHCGCPRVAPGWASAGVQWETPWGQLADPSAGWQKSAFVYFSQFYSLPDLNQVENSSFTFFI